MLSFNADRNPSHHPDDFASSFGDGLVCLPGYISVLPGKLVFRNDTGSNFI
jgi:hypothetical protein